MPTGTFTTYDLTVGTKLDVEDMIWTITPDDVPLLGTQGADGRTALSEEEIFEVKYEWLDEVLLVPRSTVAATIATADTYITVASGMQANFQTGDVLRVDSGSNAEGMLVTGYGTTTDTLTVTREFNTASAIQHVPGVVVIGTGQANPEGSDAGIGRAVDRNDRYNYSQILGPTVVQVSGTENAVAKYGLRSTEFDHQVSNRIRETFVSLEQAILYGTRFQDTGSKVRTMGGMAYYIQTNVDSTSTQVSDTTLLGNLKAVYDAGGLVDRLVMGSKQKQAASQINVSDIRYAQDTNIRGQKVDYYDSDFGRGLLILDRWCDPHDIFGFSREQASVCTLRPIAFEMLAKTGDSMKGQVIGEKGFMFRRESHAFWMNNLS